MFKCGRNDGKTEGRKDGGKDRLKTVYPPKTTFCGGYNSNVDGMTERRKDGRTDRLKTVYPPKTTFCGGYNNNHRTNGPVNAHLTIGQVQPQQ